MPMIETEHGPLAPHLGDRIFCTRRGAQPPVRHHCGQTSSVPRPHMLQGNSPSALSGTPGEQGHIWWHASDVPPCAAGEG